MFIKLTIFRHHRIGWPDNGTPTWIAYDKIAVMEQNIAAIVETDADLKLPVKDRKQETFTTLVFAFSGGEGAETASVQETPEQIMALIKEQL